MNSGGELLTAMKENGERHPGGNNNFELQPAIQKLADIGIEPTQAHRWQLIASIPHQAQRSPTRPQPRTREQDKH